MRKSMLVAALFSLFIQSPIAVHAGMPCQARISRPDVPSVKVDLRQAEPKQSEPWVRIVKGAFVLLSLCLNVVLLTHLVQKAKRRKRRYYP